ncbi:MAG: response regulator [Candidatus Binatia bacterium]
MDKEDLALIESLMPTFLEDLEEHAYALNSDLLALESTTAIEERSELFRSLFRTAHTIKGASAMMNVPLLEESCHHFEDILGALRDNLLSLTPDLLQLLFETADGVEDVRVRLQENNRLDDSALVGLVPRLALALMDKQMVPGTGSSNCPSAPENGAGEPVAPAAHDTDALSTTAPSAPSAGEALEAEPPTHAPQTPEPPSTQQAEKCDGSALDSSLKENAVLRVKSEKLDRLMNRANELLLVHGRTANHEKWLRDIMGFIDSWSTGSAVSSNGGAATAALGQGIGVAPPRDESRSNLKQLAKKLDQLATELTRDRRVFGQTVASVEEEVRNMRMFPFGDACQGLARMARDIAKREGKEVEFLIEGADVELDRSILEALRDPLSHLVRNAIDHGLEEPEQRRAAGKDARGRVVVAAALRGAQVEVSITDDGGGLDSGAIRAQAQQRGLPLPNDSEELADLLFHSGFSTAPMVTEISGRGVGLDVVKSTVETLHGTVDLFSEPGSYTRFVLTLPLTLTTADALLVKVGDCTSAVLTANVHQLLRIRPEDVRIVEGQEVVSVKDRLVRVVPLAETLGITNPEGRSGESSSDLMILSAGGKQAGFLVDELVSEQRVIVKNLGARLKRVKYVSGATLLPDGQIALILNASELVRSALGGALSVRSSSLGNPDQQQRKRVLVVEDNTTTRVLEKTILEAAGYDVLIAVDGAEAWEILQGESVDIVLTDVDMPNMDGFALTETIRNSHEHRDLAVVLVTSRESSSDKARGIDVGANAYIVKSAFDQKGLLEIVSQLI